MSAVAHLPPTVTPLMARLGSDSDGERLACLRQLDRVPEGAGLTWTDLARRLGDCEAADRDDPDERIGHWRIAVQWILSHPDWQPTEPEKRFVMNMRRILKRHEPTEKQARWIESIVSRLGGSVDV